MVLEHLQQSWDLLALSFIDSLGKDGKVVANGPSWCSKQGETLAKGLKLFSLAPPMFRLAQQSIGSLVEYETGWFVIGVLNAKHNGLSNQMPFYPDRAVMGLGMRPGESKCSGHLHSLWWQRNIILYKLHTTSSSSSSSFLSLNCSFSSIS